MYETLAREAENECIEVIEISFKGKIKGLYYNRVIAINKHIETTAEKTCILAEELGHYYTTAGNILDQKQLTNRKLERRARAWAYRRLVPLDKLVEAYKDGIKNRFELAEYLQVTEKFLDEALKYYKEKYGMYYRLGKYWICFEPLGILENLENIDNFFNHAYEHQFWFGKGKIMFKAVAYARYSSDNQREESIEAQLRAIKEYCNRNNMQIVKIYTDEAKSATTDDRLRMSTKKWTTVLIKN